jgi:hypothetical protein
MMKQEEPKDPSLGTPGEAARGKHADSLRSSQDSSSQQNTDEATAQRRNDWEDGLRAGREQAQEKPTE